MWAITGTNNEKNSLTPLLPSNTTDAKRGSYVSHTDWDGVLYVWANPLDVSGGNFAEVGLFEVPWKRRKLSFENSCLSVLYVVISCLWEPKLKSIATRRKWLLGLIHDTQYSLRFTIWEVSLNSVMSCCSNVDLALQGLCFF